MIVKFNHKDIDRKWQRRWEETKIFSTKDMLSAKSPFYNLWMFPYPSGEGLHAGHAFSSTGSDVYGRYMLMQGKNLFQPIGYDSFGIHSENFALKTKRHPQEMLEVTTKRYEDQLKSLGHAYDWNRTITTSDVNYYKWTQWLFVEMFKSGLAYRKEAEVNWCPSCKTVLADEQVMTPKQAEKDPKNEKGEVIEDDGNILVCERCGTVVERKLLKQWFFRITEYADRLLDNLDHIDWPSKIKVAQRNWIGRKEGINITYHIKDTQKDIVTFTTRPDTNFGATFIVVSPEYAKAELVEALSDDFKNEVSEYIEVALSKNLELRKEETKEKTGVFTGLYAINPLNGYEMPVWVSDFVLKEVGTGAVVGVPGHDIRDFQFASKFGIEIKRVVVGSDGDTSEITKEDQVQESNGVMVNSDFLDGLEIHEAKVKIMDHLEKNGWGVRFTAYHLRDWLISRQRYWGPPIPMIYCQSCATKGKSYFNESDGVIRKDQSDWEVEGWYPDENLPVELPYLEEYKPKGGGRGPLEEIPGFYETKCPSCGGKAKRETDVSDTFLDSSWYFLRYPTVGSEKSKIQAFGEEITKKWLPVDLYFGGAEHSVLHLMYARFVTQVLNDLGLINFEEPFPRFFAHGLMIKDGAKMSKSRGNVVNPDEYIKKYGADVLRVYLMFMGPMDGYPDFRDTGIEGTKRFINRLWGIFQLRPELDKEEENKLSIKMHQTIKKVSEDIQKFQYNTAISSIMELTNFMRDIGGSGSKGDSKVWKEALEVLSKLITPFAPHLAEEVWVEVLKNSYSVHQHGWPTYDENKLKINTVIIPVQENGRLRTNISVEADMVDDEKYIISLALKDEKIKSALEGKELIKKIYVPGKILNLVTSS